MPESLGYFIFFFFTDSDNDCLVARVDGTFQSAYAIISDFYIGSIRIPNGNDPHVRFSKVADDYQEQLQYLGVLSFICLERICAYKLTEEFMKQLRQQIDENLHATFATPSFVDFLYTFCCKDKISHA